MTDSNFEKYLVKEPIRKGRSDKDVRNRTFPPMTYMSDDQVAGIKYNVEFGWVWGMPDPNPFLHERVGSYDEILLHIGGDHRNPEDLGADIEYSLGGQVMSINSTGAVYIPRGLRHGPLRYKEFRHPHMRVSILLGTGRRPEAAETVSPSLESENGVNAVVDYEKYLVKKPAYEVVPEFPVANRQGPSSMTLMSKNLVPECNIYIECGWVWGMPDPNPHIFEHNHGFEELVLHCGADHEHPEDLGGEIEFSVGGQPLKVDKTSMVFVPQSVSHGPLVWKAYRFPHLEMAIIPGASTLDDADPGGHREKMRTR